MVKGKDWSIIGTNTTCWFCMEDDEDAHHLLFWLSSPWVSKDNPSDIGRPWTEFIEPRRPMKNTPGMVQVSHWPSGSSWGRSC